MKKRLTALSLSCLLLLSLLPLSAGAISFSDVPQSHSASAAVQYVCTNGLMNGMGDGTFQPEGNFTRAMFVTILGRMAGVKTASYPGKSFSDVSTTDPGVSWAAPYIQWAAQKGIVNGVGEGKFAPYETITREQYCTILLRYLNAVGVTNGGMPSFAVELADDYAVSDYAVAGVQVMVGYGLIDLYPDGRFIPQHWMTRGEIAQSFALVHQFLHGGVRSAALLPKNAPFYLLYGLPAGQKGNVSTLQSRELFCAQGDYWYSLSADLCVATCFHSAVVGRDHAYALDVSRSGVCTGRGIAVGSTRAQVKAAYPKNLSSSKLAPFTGDYLWYNESGKAGSGWTLLFFFQNDRVSRILSHNFLT